MLDSLRDTPPPFWMDKGMIHVYKKLSFNNQVTLAKDKIINDLEPNDEEYDATKFLESLNQTYDVE